MQIIETLNPFIYQNIHMKKSWKIKIFEIIQLMKKEQFH